jgi:transcriptional regulator GlxA family with amidase domain
MSVDAIARAVGLTSPATLRQQFAAVVKVSPTAYRRRFRVTPGSVR